MKIKYILALILIVGMISGLTTPYTITAYETSITVKNNLIAFDLFHGGFSATEELLAPIVGNLTKAGNDVIYINNTWSLPDEVAALFLTQSVKPFSRQEANDIISWLNLGDKLLIVAGDSDYGGYFVPTYLNDLLDRLGVMLRLDSTSIADTVQNDGADYRVGVNNTGYGDPLYDDLCYNLTEGIPEGHGIILHGPCSLLVDDGAYLKGFRYFKSTESIQPSRLEVIYTYSPNSTSSDSDLSETDYDYYANTTEGTGDYPAIVYEYLPEYHDSHLIVSGEAFYTYYKQMYDQTTEEGVFNNGTTYGMMFTNNIINWFLPAKGIGKTSYEFLFSLIPLAIIGAVYVLIRRRK